MNAASPRRLHRTPRIDTGRHRTPAVAFSAGLPCRQTPVRVGNAARRSAVERAWHPANPWSRARRRRDGRSRRLRQAHPGPLPPGRQRRLPRGPLRLPGLVRPWLPARVWRPEARPDSRSPCGRGGIDDGTVGTSRRRAQALDKSAEPPAPASRTAVRVPATCPRPAGPTSDARSTRPRPTGQVGWPTIPEPGPTRAAVSATGPSSRRSMPRRTHHPHPRRATCRPF